VAIKLAVQVAIELPSDVRPLAIAAAERIAHHNRWDQVTTR